MGHRINEEVQKLVMDKQMPLNAVKAVRCVNCQRLHEVTSQDFVAVYGNITVGLSGGIVGNNIVDNKLINVSVYCSPCFRDYIVNTLDPQSLIRRENYEN